ncbi:hypothetical protein [Labrys neptuniae]
MAGNAERCPDAVLQRLRPAILLLNFHATRPIYEGHGDRRLVDEIGLDRTQGNPSPEEVERLEADRQAMSAAWAADPAFIAAVERLRGVGVTLEFTTDSDSSGVFALLRLKIAADDLGKLEGLAAEDSGYGTPEQLASAAERFRIFFLRNYHPDWQRNRELHPDVGGSPYSDPTTWREST